MHDDLKDEESKREIEEKLKTYFDFSTFSLEENDSSKEVENLSEKEE